MASICYLEYPIFYTQDWLKYKKTCPYSRPKSICGVDAETFQECEPVVNMNLDDSSGAGHHVFRHWTSLPLIVFAQTVSAMRTSVQRGVTEANQAQEAGVTIGKYLIS
jgi:hypothetical protein